MSRKIQKISSIRKSINKKTRFEIFKRDNFQCQYCGRYAPEVILEIDHITPIKHEGKTENINLITACFDCNHGKGARELSDSQILEQQRQQLNEINTRKEQMQMLIQWKRELLKLEDTQIDEIENLILKPYNRSLTDIGRNKLRRIIKRYGFSETYESAQISLSNYYIETTTDEAGAKCFSKIFDYVPRICANRERAINDPLLPRKAYLIGILKNKFSYYGTQIYKLRDDIDKAFTSHATVEEAIALAKTATYTEWREYIEPVLEVANGKKTTN